MPTPTLLRRVVALSILGAVALASSLFLFPSQQDCKAESPAQAAKSGSAAAIPVEVLVVQSEPFLLPVPATGTLVPQESVTLVSELSRRLTKVHANEGEAVKKGAILFELDSKDLVAERQRLTVQLSLAEKNATRQKELLKESVTTQAEVDAAETAEQEVLANKGILDVSLARTTIRAPFDGVLGLRQVSEGAWVSPSTPLITIQDVSALKIDFQVPERHASSVKIGGKFEVSVEGQPHPFEGEIIATEPAVNTQSRSLSVRGRIAASKGLVPGTFAKVQLPLVVEEALLVPSLAIIPGVEGRGVFVERDGKAILLPVELGPRTPERVQVLSGLSPGDKVIVSNLLRMRNGIAVRIEKTTQSKSPAP